MKKRFIPIMLALLLAFACAGANALAEGGARVCAVTLKTDGTVGLNFYLAADSALLADAGAYITLNGERQSIKNAVSVQQSDGSFLRRFSVGFCPKDYQDNITLQAFNGSGEPVPVENRNGELQESGYSICPGDVMTDIISSSSANADMKAFAAALQAYCAYAKEYFSTGAVADGTESGSAFQTYERQLSGEVPGIAFAGNTLVLSSGVTLRCIFQLTGEAIAEAYTFTADGTEVTPGTNGNSFVTEVSGIPMTELGEEHVFTVADENGSTLTVTASPLSYAHESCGQAEEDAGLAALVQEMYSFGETAKSCLTALGTDSDYTGGNSVDEDSL